MFYILIMLGTYVIVDGLIVRVMSVSIVMDRYCVMDGDFVVGGGYMMHRDSVMDGRGVVNWGSVMHSRVELSTIVEAQAFICVSTVMIARTFMSVDVLRLSVIVLSLVLMMTVFMLHLSGSEMNGLVVLSWDFMMSWRLMVGRFLLFLHILVYWGNMFILRLLGPFLASMRQMVDDALRGIRGPMPVAFWSCTVLYLLGSFLFLVNP